MILQDRALIPIHLSPSTHLLLYLWMRSFLLVSDVVSIRVLSKLAPPLPSRTGPKPVPQQKLTTRDGVYLFLNSIVEYMFAQHTFVYAASLPLTMNWTTPPLLFLGVWLLFLVDDMLYAPFHRWMHHPKVYPLFHKHHHRNRFPSRGYVDAGNEHPLEQILALSLHFLSFHITNRLLLGTLHPGSIALHLALKAVGAVLNHTGLDVRGMVFGIDYSVRAHEMHHRKPTCNFGQYVMMWDRWMGTFHAETR